MTRKHYRILARVIGENSNKSHGYINYNSFVDNLSYELKKDNRRFNAQIFKDAIENNIKKGGL